MTRASSTCSASPTKAPTAPAPPCCTPAPTTPCRYRSPRRSCRLAVTRCCVARARCRAVSTAHSRRYSNLGPLTIDLGRREVRLDDERSRHHPHRVLAAGATLPPPDRGVHPRGSPRRRVGTDLGRRQPRRRRPPVEPAPQARQGRPGLQGDPHRARRRLPVWPTTSPISSRSPTRSASPPSADAIPSPNSENCVGMSR